MIFHCKDDGAVLVHFAANGKYWCPKCKLYRTRVEVAFIKGGKDEPKTANAESAERARLTAAILDTVKML